MNTFGQVEIKQITELSEELFNLRMENLRLKGDFARAKAINDSLIEENEAFQKRSEQLEAELADERRQLSEACARWSKCDCEIKLLRAELAEERNNHDRLQDFEVAESEELREAKLYLRILLEYLAETGYNTDKLEKIVAIKRVLMKLEEENE